ncbi:cysteine desulfurase family protein [Exiguobacterium aestuarii]|uniref:cysteine desulfurase n=1 Tax=Exiguobacterium aestuarii TaxID=273527 RepID=A0ABW2PPF7_9BACL|nr:MULTISPECIES: cysteine desulfurase family protein [Exiguobacterium]MCT4784767.1 cysteine desulfurase [Exiguobacterium aestuarii]
MLYLDNSSTTPVYPEVLEAMLPYFLKEFGNPSSKYYSLAENSKNAVEHAREQLGKFLNCSSTELYFTSGATESNNWILKSVSSSLPDHQVITTVTEHSSNLEIAKYLNEQLNIHVEYLSVDQFGRINFSELESLLKKRPTSLVSIIWGNNELGSLNDIQRASELVAQYGALFHTDATHVVGKMRINLSELTNVHFLSASAHKFNGPKGIGIAYVQKDEDGIPRKLTPLIHGGGQEQGIRGGTLAVPLIVGMGKAAEMHQAALSKNIKKLEKLEEYLVQLLTRKFGSNIRFNSDQTNKIPGIVNVQFIGINNEVLVKQLAPVMAVSTGSACSSSKPSHVLQAIGLTLDEVRSSIRFSLSTKIDLDDLNIFLEL